MVLRALMSSADAPSNWDLRCDVREQLLAFLAEHYPDQLPRIRADVPAAVLAAAPDGRLPDMDQARDQVRDRINDQVRDRPRPDPGTP
jgi:hypothetical protein